MKENGTLDKTAVLQPLNYNDKEILFLNMVHLGTREYYGDVTKKIDSLQRGVYYVFYEGLYLSKNDRVIKVNDSINYLKFRKVMGLYPLVEYSKMKPFSDYISKYDLIDQPDYTDLAINPKNSVGVDLPMTVLISEFEKEKGPIELTQCDFDQKLGSGSYNCSKVDSNLQKYFLEDIVINKRNENIVKNIKQSTKSKILIVYGKKHFDGIKKMLQG